MFRITFVILFIVIALLEVSLSLVELPTVEENHIVKAEAAIRETANLLFSKLKIKEKYFKSPIKHYFIAHNYFIGITLQDYVNLKEIARLTRVDKHDEVSAYTDILNEILNEDTDKEVREVPDEDVSNTIQNLMSEIRYVTVENNTQAKEFNSEILNQIINQNNNWTEENELGTALDDYDEETISNGSSIESAVWSPEPMTRRIYQGRMTKIKRYPFMAVVQLFDQFYCAGSIIDQDLVLTAASCVQLAWNNRFFRENPAFLSVRVGSTFYAGGGEIINVQEVYFHPSYNPKNLRDNICVLRLVRHLKFGSGKNRVRRVKMIEIDRAASSLPVTTAGITTLGWGARDASNIIKGAWANRLSYSVLDIYPHHDCRDVYSKEYVGPQTFCAGFISKGSGACNRDVGGPGIVNGILVGIISFGSAVCGVPDYPTVFTKVGFYADWIEEIMEMDVPVQVAHTTRSTTYAYTTKVMLQTTTIRMEPIGDVNEIFVEAVNQEVLRNRLPEDISGEPVKSESIEIDIQSNNTDFNKPVLTTIILPDTLSTTPASPESESSDSSNASDSASEKKAKRKRKRKKKKRESVEVVLEEPMERPLKEAPKRTSERPQERLSHQPQEQRLEQKDILTIEDSMPLYEENQWQSQEKLTTITTTPQTEYEYLEREEPMVIADEKLVEETTTTTITTTTATTTTTKKPKKMRKKKTLRKRKRKKPKKETSKTTKTTQKDLKTTTKMTALRKRTTSSAEALSGLSGEEDRPTAKAMPQTKPTPDKSLTTLADNNNNPLDTLSQKEFYALLAEVLDKLERDTSKDS